MADTNRAALKTKIIRRLMSLEAEELTTAFAHYEAFLAESRLDDREMHDRDDIAGSTENLELAAAFDHPVQAHHAKIDVIENTDFAVTDTVGPGAIVALGDRRFVVAVSTSRFEADGETYMGISQQSPIYNAMKGLQAGDTFTLNEREMEIQDVL